MAPYIKVLPATRSRNRRARLLLQREVFGPILHLVRLTSSAVIKAVEQIDATDTASRHVAVEARA